ncbi:hypothetical protein PR048_019716 [Dryococelus australis]|uniref:Uncharacterized protein n=1 Tax=Dryococelus australis TaxID=614101 RepID=A0ABQ9H499_9NEOP|nr:hypothetical protein PR048_019716 [Dryococelus australis]
MRSYAPMYYHFRPVFSVPIFQQVNTQAHVVPVAQVCLRHVQTLPWSARSLDVFPLEHAWDQLKRQQSPCHSTRDSEHTVQQLWARLPQDNFWHLLDSMPDPVAACIAVRGDVQERVGIDQSCNKEPSQHSPGAISENHGKQIGMAGPGFELGPCRMRFQSFAAVSPPSVSAHHMKQRWIARAGKREIPEKIRPLAASSGTISTCKNPRGDPIRLADLNNEVLRSGYEVTLECKSRGNGKFPRKPADQLHRSARLPHAKSGSGPAENRGGGGTVAEWLACPPPTTVNRAQSPAGSQDFLKWESCRTMRFVGGSSPGSLASPALSFRRRSILT